MMRVCQRQRRHLWESSRESLLVPPFTPAFLKSASSRGLYAIAELLVCLVVLDFYVVCCNYLCEIDHSGNPWSSALLITRHCWCQKTLSDCLFMWYINIRSALLFLSQSTRMTDRQANRVTTPNTAIA